MRIRRAFAILVAVQCAACAAPAGTPSEAEPVAAGAPDPEDSGPLQEEVYDITGLDLPARDFPAPEDEPSEAPGDVLLGAVRALLSPSSRADREGARLRVTGTEPERSRIRELLALLRRPEGMLATAQVRFLTVPSRGKPEPLRMRTVRFEGSPHEALASIGSLADATVTTSPRLTLWSGQRGHARVATQFAYIAHYEATFDRSGRGRLDPVIEVATIGPSLSLRPLALSEDGGAVLLHDLRLTLMDGGWPSVEQVETPFGPVHQPRIVRLRSRLSAVLARNEALLVGPLASPAASPEPREGWVLVTCRVHKPD